MKVLISGGGIAGLAAAHALAGGGHDVTIVELAPDLRPGGQLVDLRGTSREAAERMGLLDPIRAAQLPQKGMRYVDDRGRTLAELGFEMFGGQGPVADLEILRGDLTRVLYELVAGHVYLRCGDSIAAHAADDRGVDVTFEHGAPERFDLVVAADGLHSRVRRLVWGPEADYLRSLGGVTSFFDDAVEADEFGDDEGAHDDLLSSPSRCLRLILDVERGRRSIDIGPGIRA